MHNNFAYFTNTQKLTFPFGICDTKSQKISSLSSIVVVNSKNCSYDIFVTSFAVFFKRLILHIFIPFLMDLIAEDSTVIDSSCSWKGMYSSFIKCTRMTSSPIFLRSLECLSNALVGNYFATSYFEVFTSLVRKGSRSFKFKFSYHKFTGATTEYIHMYLHTYGSGSLS